MWYPSSKLFQQKKLGNWNNVIQDINDNAPSLIIDNSIAIQENQKYVTTIKSMDADISTYNINYDIRNNIDVEIFEPESIFSIDVDNDQDYDILSSSSFP